MREVEERHYEVALDTVDDQHGSPDVFPGNRPPPAVGVVTPDRSRRVFDLDCIGDANTGAANRDCKKDVEIA
jgi:hypothetical protein